MAYLDEKWLHEVMASCAMTPASPAISRHLLPIVELQVKQLLQETCKYQRRSRRSTVTVEDLNLVLRSYDVEPIYGLGAVRTDGGNVNILTTISLDEIAKKVLPNCPMKTDIALHWLAVNGIQPSIPENPSTAPAETEENPSSLPHEMQQLYKRITGIILSAETSPVLQTVYKVFENDSGLQELIPFLSRFFYQQIKANNKRLPLLTAIIRAIHCLLLNPSVHMEYHLQQLIPVVFTCVVSSSLSVSQTENHWILRQTAAEVIAIIYNRYCDKIPDLKARISKTYLDSLEADRQLPTLYGGIVGLAALGETPIRTILLPNLERVQYRLCSNSGEISNKQVTASDTDRMLTYRCKEAVLQVLGDYIVNCVRSSNTQKVQQCRTYLCELEEALVPYYASVSKEAYYARLCI